MPVVDLQSRKIVNARRGTLSYYHEKGHLVFANTDRGILFDYSSDFYLRCAVGLLVINAFFNNIWIKFLNLAFILGMVILYLYEEIYCWNYAFKTKYKKDYLIFKTFLLWKIN